MGRNRDTRSYPLLRVNVSRYTRSTISPSFLSEQTRMDGAN
jgi:hypothetical protein